MEQSRKEAPAQATVMNILTFDPLIIHDLRNPLGTVSACAEMLIGMPLTPDYAKRLGRNIHKAAGRMQDLPEELAGGTQTAVESCNLSAIIASVREDAGAAAENRGVGIILDLPAGMEVTIARTLLDRVFVNLVTNALEAMPRCGTIRISARVTAGYSSRLSLRERDMVWDWDWRYHGGPSANAAAICGSNLPLAPVL